MYLDARREGGAVTVAPRGDWQCAVLAAISGELDALRLEPGEPVHIDCAAARFDLSGAWLLHDFRVRAAAAGHEVSIAGTAPLALALVERTLSGWRAPPKAPLTPAALPRPDAV